MLKQLLKHRLQLDKSLSSFAKMQIIKLARELKLTTFLLKCSLSLKAKLFKLIFF